MVLELVGVLIGCLLFRNGVWFSKNRLSDDNFKSQDLVNKNYKGLVFMFENWKGVVLLCDNYQLH